MPGEQVDGAVDETLVEHDDLTGRQPRTSEGHPPGDLEPQPQDHPTVPPWDRGADERPHHGEAEAWATDQRAQTVGQLDQQLAHQRRGPRTGEERSDDRSEDRSPEPAIHRERRRQGHDSSIGERLLQVSEERRLAGAHRADELCDPERTEVERCGR
jgi:hypothetical protein